MPTLPESAEHRSPLQRIPESFSLTNFSGIRSSAASSSVVNRGQFDEYEQHAPQAWQGLVSAGAMSVVSIAGMLAQKYPRVVPANAGTHTSRPSVVRGY